MNHIREEKEVSEIEDRLKLLQKQIESTTEPMIRASLFLKRVELLKLQKPNNNIDYKKIIDELERYIK
ncbi:hypothetical protein ES705_43378 [subsurface metagenome]